MATERQVLAIVDEIVTSVERAADLPDDREPVSTLLGRFGEDASAGRTEEWRMAHPSSSDEDDGSRQQVWTKTLKALRHFAADKVAGKTLMERGFTTYWDNWNASKARDPQKKTDGLGKNSENHGASCLGGPSVPGMLADVVGRVVPRPAVESCESVSKVPVARQLLSPLDDHADQRLDDHPATQEKTNGDDNGSRQRA